MRKLLIGIFILSYVTFAFAEGPGTREGITLSYPVGARAIGMGKAFVAVANDVSAIYWNPAGLVSIKDKEFAGHYSDGLVDTSYKFMGYAQPIRFGAIGCGVSTLDGGKATIYSPDGTTRKVTAQSDSLFVLSYANKIRGNLLLGGNLKMIHSELGEISKATAFAFDLGGLYSLKAKNLTFGVVVQNMGTKMEYQGEEELLPVNIKVGTAYRFNNLLLALDINKPTGNELYFSAGVEYWIARLLALRAGYKLKQEGNESGTGLRAGVGFMIGNYQLDYAYVRYGDLGNTHHLSLIARF